MRLHEAAEKLISKVKDADDYFPQNDFFRYYRAISGWINDKYLDVYFRDIEDEGMIEIAFTTKCKEEVREILSEWYDLIINEEELR